MTFLSRFRAWLRCALGFHAWKRAVRIAERVGEQRCARCAETREVPLRRSTKAKVREIVAKLDAAPPPSQWPPREVVT